MRSKIMTGMLATGLLIIVGGGIGCQKQGKPDTAKKVSGLNRVNFDFDSSAIKSEAKKTLESNAGWMKKNDDNVVVEGHCDERGTEEYNIALGQRRAKSSKDYLVSLGIDSKRLNTKSYGEEKPLETCHNESCWWKNRRAEFLKKK